MPTLFSNLPLAGDGQDDAWSGTFDRMFELEAARRGESDQGWLEGAIASTVSAVPEMFGFDRDWEAPSR